MAKLTMEIINKPTTQINSYKIISRTLNNPANKDVAIDWTNKLDAITQRSVITKDDELLYSFINVQYLLIQMQEESMRQCVSAFSSILDIRKTILKKELNIADCNKKDVEKQYSPRYKYVRKIKNGITSMDKFN